MAREYQSLDTGTEPHWCLVFPGGGNGRRRRRGGAGSFASMRYPGCHLAFCRCWIHCHCAGILPPSGKRRQLDYDARGIARGRELAGELDMGQSVADVGRCRTSIASAGRIAVVGYAGVVRWRSCPVCVCRCRRSVSTARAMCSTWMSRRPTQQFHSWCTGWVDPARGHRAAPADLPDAEITPMTPNTASTATCARTSMPRVRSWPGSAFWTFSRVTFEQQLPARAALAHGLPARCPVIRDAAQPRSGIHCRCGEGCWPVNCVSSKRIPGSAFARPRDDGNFSCAALSVFHGVVGPPGRCCLPTPDSRLPTPDSRLPSRGSTGY